MAKSYDKDTMEYDINDDIIKLALKTELSSIKASSELFQETISKCEAEIAKQKQKNKLFMSQIMKIGAPIAAGAFALILVFKLPGAFNLHNSSDQLPQLSSSVGIQSERYVEDMPPNQSPDQDIKNAIRSEEFFSETEPLVGAGIGGWGQEGEEDQSLKAMQADFVKQGEGDFSVYFDDNFISLKDKGSMDSLVSYITGILGQPENDTSRELDDSADSFKGVTVRTMEFDGLTITISGFTTYSIDSINITNESFSTHRGINVGMSLDALKSKYKNISQAIDGRTDLNNCAYSLTDNDHYLIFEVEEGSVTRIMLYWENG